MNRLHVSSGKLKLTATSALLAAALAALASITASAQTVWTAGHGDVGIAYEGGELDPHVHIHAGSTVDGVTIDADAEYAPGEALPYISFADGVARPVGSQWDFLGVSAGQTVWIFPQTQSATLPFIGFGAEELDPLDWSSAFTIKLTGLSGSGAAAGGQFSVYQTDGFGTPTAQIQSYDGITGSDVVTLAAGGHEHYNFAFTQPGLYEVSFLIEGNHAIDGALSATATYTFGVAAIPEPASYAALAGLGIVGFTLARRRRARV